jgi:Flp pilus assembly pilin Flp
MGYGKLQRYVACVVALAKGRDGQALAEFAMVLAFVAMAAVLALTALGLTVGGFYDSFVEMIS